jgi:hypothetical protein
VTCSPTNYRYALALPFPARAHSVEYINRRSTYFQPTALAFSCAAKDPDGTSDRINSLCIRVV